MSLDASTAGIVLSLISLALVLGLCVLFIRSERRMKKMLRGKNIESFEDSIIATQKELNGLLLFQKETAPMLSVMEEKIKKSIGGIGTVRFNPFRGTSGSNQSFAVAFLDREKNGVVISSIYSREHVATFAKPIRRGNSEYEITREEREAINQATQQ